MKLTPEFRDRLNELIEKRKLTNEQCVMLFKISDKALYNARTHGIYPTTGVISRIAQFFEVSEDYLLGLTNKKITQDIKKKD